jgi:hypothetical protein
MPVTITRHDSLARQLEMQKIQLLSCRRAPQYLDLLRCQPSPHRIGKLSPACQGPPELAGIACPVYCSSKRSVD